MKTTYLCLFLLCAANICPQALGQTPRKAIINDDYNLGIWHQAFNYSHFLDRAPILGSPSSSSGWTCVVAGAGHGTIPGLDWNPFSGGPMIQHAVDEGFEIVMHYGKGLVDPDVVHSAANQGCAVFCFHSEPNDHHYYDYSSFTGSPIQGRGPTPAMIVTGGYSSSSAALLAYGPQGEFMDAVNDGSDCAQSWAHSATAARYAKLRDLHPTWNVFDLRQCLRQTCTFYASGWRENGGYGFPLVSNRVGNVFPETQIANKSLEQVELSDLDAGPPIQPRARILPDGNSVEFKWYNFEQTGFESTVIKIDGVTVYDDDSTEFVWTSDIYGSATAEFFTKLSDGRISRNASLEPYTKILLRGIVTNVDTCAALVTPQLTTNNFSFVVTAPSGGKWNVYKSEDLESWQLYGGVWLTDTTAIFTDTNITGIGHRFYRVSNGECCSETVGFTRVTAVPGYTFIANQLDATVNTLSVLFTPGMADGSVLPNGTKISKWNGTSYDDYTYSSGSWSPNGDATLNPGEAAFIFNPTNNPPFTVSFAGFVQEGNITQQIPSGQTTLSYGLPKAGDITSDLGYNPSDFDVIYFWDTTAQNFSDSYIFSPWSGWTKGSVAEEPPLTVGHGLFLNNSTNNSWTRNFSPCAGQIECARPVLSLPSIFTQGFEVYSYLFDLEWYKDSNPVDEPALTIGQGFYFSTSQQISWQRNFSTHPGEPTCSQVTLVENQLTDTSFAFDISDLNSGQFEVQASENLIDWDVVDVVSLSGGDITFTDAGIEDVSQRFYRLTNGTCVSRSVGFIRLRIPAGTTLTSSSAIIANQLEQSTSTLSSLFAPTMPDGSSLPNGTKISKWNGATYDTYTFSSGSWSPNGNATLDLGEAAFIENQTTHVLTISFVGLVPEGNISRTIPAGQSLVSSVIPQAGGISSILGYTPSLFDQVQFFGNRMPLPAPLSDDSFSFNVSAPLNSHWTVSSSEDLSTWQTLGNVTFSPENITFTDPSITGIGHRFYRVSNGECCSETVGFTRVTAVPGYTFIANQLDATVNTLSVLFTPGMADGSVLPNGTKISKWNGTSYDDYTYSSGSWSPNGDATLNPGEAAFIFNPTNNPPFTVSFAGFVQEGNITQQIPSGQTTLSYGLPKAGDITSDLGYNPSDFDVIYFWDTTAQNFSDSYIFSPWSGWTKGSVAEEPPLTVGHGLFLNNSTNNSWTRNFSPCD